MIIKARKYHSSQPQLRKFVLPEIHHLDFRANNVMDFIKWNDLSPEQISPASLLQNFNDNELANLKIEDIPNLKCHSQDNERQIKTTTFVASKNIGEVNQKRAILCTKKSRTEFPINANKSAFYP